MVKRKTGRKGLFVISKDGPRRYLLVWKALFGTPARASPGDAGGQDSPQDHEDTSVLDLGYSLVQGFLEPCNSLPSGAALICKTKAEIPMHNKAASYEA